MPDHTTLRGVSQVGDSLLSDQLEANCLGFLQWAFLGAGGFFNVRIPSSGWFGGDQHRLRRAEDPNFQPGQVWEGFRKDWVWETGVECPYQPLRVSGVYVNGGFHPLGETGSYAHHIDYPLGRVVFDNPLPASSVLTCEYSYRLFQCYTADTPWWQQVQPGSFRVDDSHFLQQGSGAWSVLGQNRVQLPALVVEALPRTDRKPYELGSTAQIVRQEVLFHVLTEERSTLKFLHDALTYQQDKRLLTFDKNLLFAQDKFPLDDGGSPVASGLMYPDLVRPTDQGGCGWRQVRIMATRSQDQPRLGSLRYTTVRWTSEIDL